MSTEENKALIRRRLEVMWNEGDLEAAREFLSPDAVHHSKPGIPPGREYATQMAAMYLSAFPDLQCVVEDQIAEGDKVVTRWTMTGTHSGDFLGVPASGKQVTVSGININRVVDGQIQEGWVVYDELGLLRQLGVIPGMGATQ
jgi:steroid delta-isomerase-like uncharacterized protein